jgi:hypothetical protein
MVFRFHHSSQFFCRKPLTDHEPGFGYSYIARSGSWQRS